MQHQKKNELAKIALTALILSALLPITGYASEDAQTEETAVENEVCGAAFPRTHIRHIKHHHTGGTGHTGHMLATNNCGASPSRGTIAMKGNKDD